MVWLTDFKLRNDRADSEVEYVDNVPESQRGAWFIPPHLKVHWKCIWKARVRCSSHCSD